jgi:hypothetical protein
MAYIERDSPGAPTPPLVRPSDQNAIRKPSRGPRVSPIYAAIVSASVMAVVGMLGLWGGQPWLFPSLGPTIFLCAVSPNEPGTRPWNIIVGHGVGVAAGFAALFVFGAQHEPPALGAEGLTAARVAATALAVGATVAFQFLVDARHPPAAATTMLITLGGLTAEWNTIFVIIVGVGLVATLGEGVRRWNPDR